MIRVFLNTHLVQIESFVFPGGEVGVKVIPRDSHTPSHIHIEALPKNSEDVILLLLVKDALDRMFNNTAHRTLDLFYLPYARQDRVCNKGESLSVSVMASLINFMQFDKVTLHDPHSDVGPALIDNCCIVDQVDGLVDFFGGFGGWYDIVIAPDAGAAKKVFKVAQFLNAEMRQAQKVRNVKTGEIVATQIDATDMKGKRVLVVDDICDGGMTFIKLAEVIRDQTTPSQLDLFVTHGIFSKGAEVLSGYDNVYSKFNWSEMR